MPKMDSAIQMDKRGSHEVLYINISSYIKNKNIMWSSNATSAKHLFVLRMSLLW